MYPSNQDTATNTLTEKANQSAQDAIKSTQGLVSDALNDLTDRAENLRNDAKPVIDRVGRQASAMAQRGADAIRDRSQQLRDSARQASDRAADYIRDEPVRSVLMAAATGAALMGLVALLARSSDRR